MRGGNGERDRHGHREKREFEHHENFVTFFKDCSLGSVKPRNG